MPTSWATRPTRARFGKLAGELRAKLMPTFWDEKRQALVHDVENGKQSEQVNKFANMFAITLGYLDDATTDSVMKNVMLDPEVPAITTPYMRFYELEALCSQGMQKQVLKEMKDYWGGMLKEGATSFWEKYNPGDSGTQHLAMYGRPYGKSLCHAWGSEPDLSHWQILSRREARQGGLQGVFNHSRPWRIEMDGGNRPDSQRRNLALCRQSPYPGEGH